MLAIMSLSFSKVAIVTGGTRGIGAAISKQLARDGHDLLLTYNSDDVAADIHATRLELAFQRRVVCVKGDLSRSKVRSAVFEAFDRYFYGEVLVAAVHNAGQYIGVTSENAENLASGSYKFGTGDLCGKEKSAAYAAMRYYQKLYGEAYIDICEQSISRMKQGGALLGISSPGCNFAYKANPGYDLPGSGKCIMEYAMRLFALQCGPQNISCNVLIPGVTPTDAWSRLAHLRNMSQQELVSTLANRVAPMGSTLADEIGAAVGFLCSPAGRSITGVSLPVDRGVHLKI